MLGLSPGIEISISSKTGHSTFVLSTIDMLVVVYHIKIKVENAVYYVTVHHC